MSEAIDAAIGGTDSPSGAPVPASDRSRSTPEKTTAAAASPAQEATPPREEQDQGWTENGQPQEPEPSRDASSWVWKVCAMARYRLAAAILGGGWLGLVTRQRLIVQRARDCITPDGRVILANCAPLAEALYDDIPGEWTLLATRTRTEVER